MSVELFGEKDFLSALDRTGSLWVAFKNKQAFVKSDSTGSIAIPVWTSMELASEYIEEFDDQDLRPLEVPLEVFEKGWLNSVEMNIQEIIANPKMTKVKKLHFTKQEILDWILKRDVQT